MPAPSSSLVGGLLVVIAAAMSGGGCATATRPVVEPSAPALAATGAAVVVVKFSMPAETCIDQMLTIGVREGNGHRLVRRLVSRGAVPAATANAAEAELPPGEYHVLGYVCRRKRSALGVGGDGGPYTSSIARFTLAPGEVVNIGHLTFRRGAARHHLALTVRDWSVADLNRLRDERPAVFAAMRTRLAEVGGGVSAGGPEREAYCAQMQALLRSGKLQSVAEGCS